MKKSPYKEKEERFILLADIGKLAVYFRKKILLGALFCSLVACYYSFSRPIRFEAKATFKEGGIAKERGDSLVNGMLRFIGAAEPSIGGEKIILCYDILREVVETLGLQGDVVQEGKIKRFFQNIKEQLQAELKSPLEEVNPFLFASVHYEKEKGKQLYLFFPSRGAFEVYSAEKILLGKGKVGKEFSLEEFSFTLKKTPKVLKLSHFYPFQLHSLLSKILFLQKEVEVLKSPEDPTILLLSFKHRDRFLAKEVLSTIMSSYKNYLVKESHLASLAQIGYLEQREKELFDQMNHHLKEHMTYLKENMGEGGFLSVKEELTLLNKKRQQFQEKLLTLSLEEKRTKEKRGAFSTHPAFASQTEEMKNQIASLKKRADALEISSFLTEREPPVLTKQLRQPFIHINELSKLFPFSEKKENFLLPKIPLPSLEEKLNLRLKQVRSDITNLENLLGKEELSPSLEFSKALVHICKHLPPASTPEDLLHFAKHQLRLMHLKEKILKEKLLTKRKEEKEYQGLTLKMAEELYIEYIKQSDQIEEEKRKLLFAREELGKPNIELISLSSVLTDPISHTMIKQLGELSLRIRDQRILTEKEVLRLKREMERLNGNLLRHMDQTAQLLKLQGELSGEKIASLSHFILDLLNEEVSILEKHIEDFSEEYLINLAAEKDLAKERLEEFRKEGLAVPDRWLKENQLQLRANLSTSMFKGISSLVESKNIEYHLMQVQSKPLNPPYTLLIPHPPKIRLLSFFGFCVGIILFLFFYMVRAFVKGFPLTLHNLKMQGKTTLGKLPSKAIITSLSSLGQKELDLLRRMTFFISQTKEAVILLQGESSCYLFPLAELLKREGKKVLCIDLEGKFAIEKTSPLVEYLEEKIDYLQIKEGTVDLLSIGENSLFTLELLKREKFSSLLEELKNSYDLIFLCINCSPSSPIIPFLLSVSDRMFVTFDQETQDDLAPLFAWEEEKGEKGLAFLEKGLR